MEFWHCFVFWKQCVYLAIKNQIFNRHSMPLSVRKMSRQIFKDCHRQTPKPVVWTHSLAITPQPKGAIFSHRKRWVVLTWLKHHTIIWKQGFQHLKAFFIHFIQFCGPWITHKKWHSSACRSSYKMTKISLLVTLSTIFFLPFHLAIGRQRCPKKLG